MIETSEGFQSAAATPRKFGDDVRRHNLVGFTGEMHSRRQPSGFRQAHRVERLLERRQPVPVGPGRQRERRGDGDQTIDIVAPQGQQGGDDAAAGVADQAQAVGAGQALSRVTAASMALTTLCT